MIADRKEFSIGAGMMALFLIVLGLFFAPLYDGHNGLAYLDNLYNSISKGSSNYIDMVQETAQKLQGMDVKVSLSETDAAQLEVMTTLLEAAGSQVVQDDKGISVSADLGTLLLATVRDVDNMYYNRGSVLTERYQIEARRALYTWWVVLGQVEKQLKKQKLFAGAKDVALVVNRGVEPAYNYYGVEAQSISQRVGVVIFSLVFYVAFTLWYGFAILFMFEGWGLKLEH